MCASSDVANPSVLADLDNTMKELGWDTLLVVCNSMYFRDVLLSNSVSDMFVP